MRLAPAGLALGVVLAIATLHAVRPGFWRDVEAWIFDRYQTISPRPFEEDGIVRVVDIDEASLARLGQWPWPRSFLAAMIERLTDAGVAVIAFDMVFAEADRTSPRHIVEVWQRYNQRFLTATGAAEVAALEMALIDDLPDHDAILAEIIGESPVVLGRFLSGGLGRGTPAVKGGVSVLGSPVDGALVSFEGVVENLPGLVEPASGLGSVSLAPSGGETVRRVPLIARAGGVIVPALSVEALRVAQGARGYLVQATDAGGEIDLRDGVGVASMRVGGLVLPLEPDGTLRVRFAGARPERRIPAWQVLDGAAMPPALAEEVRGRIILVGTSAPGLRDLVTTPLERDVPGVEVHAEIVEQAVAQTFLARPDWAVGRERLVLLAGGALVVVLIGAGLPVLAIGAMALGAAGALGGGWYAFEAHGLLLSPVGPTIGPAGALLVGLSLNFFLAERSRREITGQFQHFVAPEVIEEIVADPERYLKPGGESRELAVMFVDMRGFSTKTEDMTPEEVISFVNELLTPLTDVVLENEGTVDKYMGDAVMAFWNAPKFVDDMDAKAVATALRLLDAAEAISADNLAAGRPDVRVAIGINTGPCSVGNMGSTRRLSYSCVGDPVNLASRLEGQTRRYVVDVLVGETTAARVIGSGGAGGGFALLALDRLKVKGRARPEEVYTVAGEAALVGTPAFEAVAATLGEARALYAARDWDGAEAAFGRLARLGGVGRFDPAGTVAEYRARIARWRERPPPPDWDGAFEALSK
ncbi:MAG: CHASE2 domain-containing protein [Paracoccaceae bacterium]